MLDVAPDLVDEMVAHATEALPREACGVLTGTEAGVDSVVRMRNVGEGDDQYAFGPEAQLDLWQALEDSGRRVWAIYHSHPTGGPYPSRVDLTTASYPDLYYVIVGGDGRVGAWLISRGFLADGRMLRM